MDVQVQSYWHLILARARARTRGRSCYDILGVCTCRARARARALYEPSRFRKYRVSIWWSIIIFELWTTLEV